MSENIELGLLMIGFSLLGEHLIKLQQGVYVRSTLGGPEESEVVDALQEIQWGMAKRAQKIIREEN